LREIIDSGLVEIGSHTLNHKYLLGIDSEIIKNEVIANKSLLENEFGIKVVSFAYPYGVFDDEIIQITKDAGYTNAVGTDLGVIVNKNNLFSIKRIRPGYNQNYGLTDYLDSLIRVRPDVGSNPT